MGTEHLIASGCRNIAHIGGPPVSTALGRLEGFRTAMERHGRPAPPAYVLTRVHGDNASDVSGYQCMTELLQKMAERDCAGIRDPRGISGNIAAIKSEAQRAAALASVKTSRDYAKAALFAERNGRINEALQQWNYAFNYKFLK